MAQHLDYPTALSCGWPGATGVIEGACRHLVKGRGLDPGPLDTGGGCPAVGSVAVKVLS